jgi:hypothetical protein
MNGETRDREKVYEGKVNQKTDACTYMSTKKIALRASAIAIKRMNNLIVTGNSYNDLASYASNMKEGW